MSPLVYAIGIGLGILGFFLLRPKPITYERTSERRRETYNSRKGDLCPICQQVMDEMKKLPCGHGLHLDCYNEFKKHFKICPICRKDV